MRSLRLFLLIVWLFLNDFICFFIFGRFQSRHQIYSLFLLCLLDAIIVLNFNLILFSFHIIIIDFNLI